MKKLLGVLLTLTMCLCMTGIVALADGDEDAVDYTSGVTLACNGEVVTETYETYFEGQDDLWGESIVFGSIYMHVEELDTITLDLLDASGNVAADTAVSVIESDDYDSADFAGTISGNVVSVTGQIGSATLKVSSASLGVSTYVIIEYFSDDFVDDLTADAILYCNGVEVTAFSYSIEMNAVEKMYYVEMTVGSTYELQFVDPTTGDVLVLSLDEYDWLEELEGVSISGNTIIVAPTEIGEEWIYGPAGVIVSYVSADTESSSSTGDSTSTSTDAATTAAAEVTTTSGDKAASETGDTSVWGYVLLLAGAAAVIAVLAKKHAEA